MSDSSKRGKVSSIAAFLFMPQFRLSFQHFSFVVPVFIRTIALMFEQAGLLPQNHPATRYGMDGVRKYKFSELMGEAWYKLRAQRSTPYQWSLFVSIVMMVVFVVLSVITTLANIAGLFIGTATAQIFDHPTGGATNAASVTSAGYTSQGMYDKSLATSGAHQDYGIMIIDKLFRQGAEGIGGPLQKAFGSLMEIYNTGVLVIAGVMLFWCVLAVVVDTAKTGVIGGNRHNMVWAPIRIVFALGLLIPLGASGFSSGQFMVMKLAEWGSNFGTRGWVTYVDNVASQTKLLVSAAPKNMTELVSQYQKMWMCRVAYNGYTQQATGSVPAKQEIKMKETTGWMDSGTKTFMFTNDTNANICGSITYKTEKDASISFAGGSDPIGQALANYKKAAMESYKSLFVGPSGDGVLAISSRRFACAFVSQYIYADGSSPLSVDCGGSGASACGAGAAGSGQHPDMSCVSETVKKAYDTVNGSMASAQSALESALNDNLLKELKKEGWAGMGRWYHEISSLNNGILSMEESTVSITGGEYKSLGTQTGLSSEHVKKLTEVMDQYDKWWQSVPATTSPSGAGATAPIRGEVSPDIPQPSGIASKVASIAMSIATYGPLGLMNAMFDIVFECLVARGNFLFDIAEPQDPSIYPLAALTKTGHSIVALGAVLVSTVALIQALLGLADASIVGTGLGSVGVTFASSVLLEMLAMAGTSILLAGMLLSQYVPLIPFIRVLFSVLTWMVSVFEAVVMVPIAALAHLHTEGEGLAGGAKGAWFLWLNILLRPMLTVVGFVGALLVFNTFVIYFHDIFIKLATASLTKNGAVGMLAIVSNTLIYVGTMYVAANSIFKLLDLIPSALMKWMGGHQDHSFDQDSHAAEGFISAGGQIVGNMGRSTSGIRGQVAQDAQRRRDRKDEEARKGAGVRGGE